MATPPSTKIKNTLKSSCQKSERMKNEINLFLADIPIEKVLCEEIQATLIPYHFNACRKTNYFRIKIPGIAKNPSEIHTLQVHLFITVQFFFLNLNH